MIGKPTDGRPHPKGPPLWAVRLNVLMLRLGVPIGTQYLLSVPGRRSGRTRQTPISVVSVAGQRYIVSAFAWADWVKNVRTAGIVELARARRRERVRLVEIPVADRPPVLRAFLRQVRGGVRFFTDGNDPDAVAASAADYAVFRLDPVSVEAVP